MMKMSHDVHSDHTDSIFGFPVTGTQFNLFAVFWVFIILLCYDRWNRRYYEPLASKLNGPPDYPIIGSVFQFIGNRYKKMLEYRKSYKHDPWKLWFGCRLGVVISRPEDLQIVLNSSSALEKGFIYTVLKKGLGEGLINAPVDKWKIHRRLINPLFKYENLKTMFLPIFNEKSEILIRNLQKQVGKTQPFNILDYLSNTTLSTICQTTMDYNLDTQSDMGFTTNIEKGLELVIQRVMKPWLYSDIIYNLYCKLFRLDKVYILAKKLPKYIIEKKQNEYVQKLIKKNSIYADVKEAKEKHLKGLLDILFETHGTENGLSDEDILSHGMTIMIAGFETNALTVSFCLLMLAIYPNIQDKVYDEIYSVISDSDEPITIEQTNKCVYLKQVIYETLRLFPVAPVYLRELQDDIKIFSGNHILPRGTLCFMSPLFTHYIPELYPNPESFNPENFSPENVAKRHKYSFIAFSGGPRNCIGMKYGLLNITVLLVDILRNFSVHSDIKLSDIELNINIALHSTIGYPITIQRRNKRNNKDMNA